MIIDDNVFSMSKAFDGKKIIAYFISINEVNWKIICTLLLIEDMDLNIFVINL